MPVFTAIAASLASLGAAAGTAGAATAATGLGAAVGAAGTIAGLAGTALQYSGQKKAASAAAEAERLRQAQANVDAIRQRRQVVRQAIVARGDAISNAAGQGAGLGSGVAGGLAQIGGQEGQNLTAIDNAQSIGNKTFAANAAQSQGQSLAATGQGLSSLGGALVKNQDAIGRLGAYTFGARAPQAA